MKKKRQIYTIHRPQEKEAKKKKNWKYINPSYFNTHFHGGRNGGMQNNNQDEGFIYENVTILCMPCNGQVIYRGRKIITYWGNGKT